MKHRLFNIIAAAAAVLLGTAACNDLIEKEPVVISKSIAVQPDSLIVKAEGDEITINFNAPDYWFASSPADWIKFEPESGKPGDNTVTVKVTQNIEQKRVAVLTVTSKTERGEFKIIQEAWPYVSGWSISGTVDGGKAIAMTDMDNGLVWHANDVPYVVGEDFNLCMGTDTVLGLDGELAADSNNTYKGSLKKEGSKITLPENGYWNITLDLNTWTVTAALSDRFPWTIIGTVGESNWDKDFQMKPDDDKLVWEVAKLAYHIGEEFKFRMNASDAVTLGLDGAFTPVANEENSYECGLKAAGGNITLPLEGYWKVTLDLTAMKVFAAFAGEFPVDNDPEIAIWDVVTPFDSWSATIEIPAAKFADAKVGDLIRVYYSDAGSDFNPIFKHMDWSDWDDLQAAKVVTDEYFEAAIPASALDELKTQGLRFQGVGFTIVKVVLKMVSEMAIWDVATPFDSWSATIEIPAAKFADANVGDFIRVFYSDKTGDFNPIFKHMDWSDWDDLQAAKVVTDEYFEAAIPASALDELKTQGLRFQGVGFTITKVVIKVRISIDIAAFTLYENQSAYLSYPYNPSWSENSGKLRIMRGGNPALEDLGLTTDSKFIVYKEVGTTGQVQFNNPNWGAFAGVDCSDWDGSPEAIEVPFTEEMLSCVNGEVTDGWSNTAIILQGDGLTVTKIVIVI